MTVGVGSSALCVFSIAILLTLFVRVVASSSLEEFVEFGCKMSVLKINCLRLDEGSIRLTNLLLTQDLTLTPAERPGDTWIKATERVKKIFMIASCC